MAMLGKGWDKPLVGRVLKESLLLTPPTYSAEDLIRHWGEEGLGELFPNIPIKLTKENNMTNSEEIQQAIDSSDGEGVLCLVWDEEGSLLQVKVMRVTAVNELGQVRSATGWSYEHGKLLGEDTLQAFRDTGLIKMTEQELLIAALERGESVSCWVSDQNRQPINSHYMANVTRHDAESSWPFQTTGDSFRYATPVKPEEISLLK